MGRSPLLIVAVSPSTRVAPKHETCAADVNEREWQERRALDPTPFGIRLRKSGLHVATIFTAKARGEKPQTRSIDPCHDVSPRLRFWRATLTSRAMRSVYASSARAPCAVNR